MPPAFCRSQKRCRQRRRQAVALNRRETRLVGALKIGFGPSNGKTVNIFFSLLWRFTPALASARRRERDHHGDFPSFDRAHHDIADPPTLKNRFVSAVARHLGENHRLVVAQRRDRQKVNPRARPSARLHLDKRLRAVLLKLRLGRAGGDPGSADQRVARHEGVGIAVDVFAIERVDIRTGRSFRLRRQFVV